MPQPGPQLPFREPSPRNTALICGGLALLFATLSYWAATDKSATYDEPLHAVAGHLVRHYGDYRIDPEDGALFTRWGALLHGHDALKIDQQNEHFKNVAEDHARQWPWVVRELYETSGVEGHAYVNRSRFMFVILGVALALLMSWWTWKLAGAIAAIAAAVMFCLDPNFMAHASLVKNDVPLSLLMLWLMAALWMLGRRATLLRIIAVALACGAALNVKFSGLLFGPIVVISLCIRALLPQPWEVLGRALRTRLARLAFAGICCVFVALVSYASIWACYSFRFLPTRDPKVTLNVSYLVEVAKKTELQAADPNNLPAPPEKVKDHRPRPIVRFIEFANEHHALPQAWLTGLLYTYATTLIRSSFIIGKFSLTGWWYFFPLAMLFKTPLATLLVGFSVLLAWIVARAKPQAADRERLDAWSLSCLLVPVIIYGGSAILTNLNLGLRHVLPLYPFIFIGIAIGLKRMLVWRPQMGTAAACALVGGLLLESAMAAPDYLAFFNVAAGGSRGGIRLLSDSNLDWGQDLTLLARWQKEHPNERLYLCYFGTVDPSFYGIRRVDMWGGWPWGKWETEIAVPSTVAISATNLQGVYLPPQVRDAYKTWFADREPREVLGGTIYIYDWPPATGPAPRR